MRAQDLPLPLRPRAGYGALHGLIDEGFQKRGHQGHGIFLRPAKTRAMRAARSQRTSPQAPCGWPSWHPFPLPRITWAVRGFLARFFFPLAPSAFEGSPSFGPSAAAPLPCTQRRCHDGHRSFHR